MSFPRPHHDHGRCIAQALAGAEAECRRRGARLTDVRRRVLELVWSSHQPVGAYAILERLAQDGWSSAPPTVYRALDFLLAHGLVHRLERLNAFIGCAHPGHDQAGQFLICARCGTVAEMIDPDVGRAIVLAADRIGFSVLRQTVEAEGLCPSCRAADTEPGP